MTIHIEALTFEVIIGLLDFERKTAQKVVVSLEIEYVYEKNHFINYADVASLVEKKLHLEKYELLEEALLGLKETIIVNYPSIKKLFIKISKPNILQNCNVSLSHSWNL